jgi:16S rRNA processing protein RimM
MTDADVFYLGKITKKHGLNGSFKVFLDVDDPFSYHHLPHAFLQTESGYIPYFFEQFDVQSDGRVIAKFEDIDSQGLEMLLGSELYLPLEALPKLEGNAFYYHEVLGWDVWVIENGGKAVPVGSVGSVQDNSGQDLLHVTSPIGEEILIPLVDSFIDEVDRNKKRLIFHLPEGLIDLNRGDQKNTES